MENFDLSRLNASSFERLIRAMCFELLGPSGTVYSSGPDGGRDFTMEGPVKGYDGWDGYLVLQAKYREKPQGGASDIKWLENQLKHELDKFKDRKAKLRRPDYYIVATNVSLSGSDGVSSRGRTRSGGHTKICNFLAGRAKTLQFKGFDVWPGDKIVDLLASAPGVRQTYAAWITVGDVLSATLRNFNSQSPDFARVIGRSLKESLRRDQHARLKDAGSVMDSQIRVSQVFIDLPASELVDLPLWGIEQEFSEEEGAPQSGVVAKLVTRSRQRFDPESVTLARQKANGEFGPAPNKIVLLGGPGQGKSTASMFLAQLFRASLLESAEGLQHDDNVRALVPEILTRAQKEGISINLPRRYPVFVSLPRFADAVSKAKASGENPPSILHHIANEITGLCDKSIDREDLRAWLKNYPWLAIFDGLDEVPPSGERNAVLDAIAAFNTELLELSADILLVVTTRPQGYNHDLGRDRWEHWTLMELPSERAVAYAEALGHARYPLDIYRRSEILLSIKEATAKPATSRLMISPLQVTIMYLIVDTGGSVPAARWTLFNEYFDILKKREKAKGGKNQKILERNWSQLGPIHQRAGLVLQTASEHAGGAVSSMHRLRFEEMLHEFLTACGYDRDEIDERAKELMSVALHRLVLLSSREEGKIAFDVRSLQEFMAAAAITSGNESDVEDRLNHIAGLAHWRHVFLIAASRCFSEDSFHHLRSRIIAIPRTLESNAPNSYLRTGAMLSLEMFVDGIGSDHPNSRRVLAQHALELLALGPNAFDDRLYQLIDEHTGDIVVSTIRERIGETDTPAALAAWRLLVGLSFRAPEKFSRLVSEYWPKKPDSILLVLGAITDPLPNAELIEKTRDAVLKSEPTMAMKVCNQFCDRIRSHKNSKSVGARTPLFDLDFLTMVRRNSFLIGVFESERNASFSLRLSTIEQKVKLNYQAKNGKTHPGWLPLQEGQRFGSHPNAVTLGRALRAVSDAQALAYAKTVIRYLPWPIASVIASARDDSHLGELAGRASAGLFGDISIWEAAQLRWVENGVSTEDFLHSANAGWITPELATVGVPYLQSYQVAHSSESAPRVTSTLIRLVHSVNDTSLKAKLLGCAHFAVLGVPTLMPLFSVGAALEILTLLGPLSVRLSLNMLSMCDPEIWENNEALNLISENAPLAEIDTWGKFGVDLEKIIDAFCKNPSRRGLLVVIVLFLGYEVNVRPDLIARLPDHAFQYGAHEDMMIKRASVLLNIVRTGISPDQSTIRLLFDSDAQHHSEFLNLLFTYLEREFFLRGDRQFFFGESLLLLSNNGAAGQYFSKCRDMLTKLVSSRKSNLTARTAWIDELHLPADAYKILKLQLEE